MLITEPLPFLQEKSKGPTEQRQPLAMFGSPARTRTTDLVVNSHPLYQLSYWGICFTKTRDALYQNTVSFSTPIFFYRQSTQVASSLSGTPVVLLMYLS